MSESFRFHSITVLPQSHKPPSPLFLQTDRDRDRDRVGPRQEEDESYGWDDDYVHVFMSLCAGLCLVHPYKAPCLFSQTDTALEPSTLSGPAAYSFEQPCLTGPAHHAQSQLPHCQPVCLAELHTVPIPATLDLWLSQFWLPEWHQLESRSDVSSHLEPHCRRRLKTQVQSSNFSPDAWQRRSPTYSPEWVTLHDFSLAFQVSSCQAEWLLSIANLNLLMSKNRGLFQVQIIRFKNKWVFIHCFIVENQWHEFININSDIWFHDILHDHKFISEFILCIHVWFYDPEFICYILSRMNLCMWRTLQNHICNQGASRFQMVTVPGPLNDLNPILSGIWALWFKLWGIWRTLKWFETIFAGNGSRRIKSIFFGRPAVRNLTRNGVQWNI